MSNRRLAARFLTESNIRSSEGSGTTTLTLADNPRQVFNLTAARTVVLPTTGVLAGDIYYFQNLGAFDLTVQASGGTSFTVANGANIDSTIRKGYVTLIAKQAAPTTPAHWRVQDLVEEGALTGTTQGAVAVTYTSYWKRFDNSVHYGLASDTATASANAFIGLPVSGLGPSRLYPSSNIWSAYTVRNNSSVRGAVIQPLTDGSCNVSMDSSTNFSGNCGLGGNGTQLSWFTYYLGQ